MKINFRKITVTDIDGNKSTVDIAKELGNAIYKQTQDIGELEFAREIYHKGEIDLSIDQIAIVRKYMDTGGFFAFVKEGVENLLIK